METQTRLNRHNKFISVGRERQTERERERQREREIGDFGKSDKRRKTNGKVYMKSF